MIDAIAKKVLLSRLPHLKGGALTLLNDAGLSRFGSLEASAPGLLRGRPPIDAKLVVHDERFYRQALLGSDIGIGEAYMDGHWSSPDVVSAARLMICNAALVEQQGGVVRGLVRLSGAVARRLRDNSLAGSRRHIHEHYDLGNDFFRLFLDEAQIGRAHV